jgi:hypothetical protein
MRAAGKNGGRRSETARRVGPAGTPGGWLTGTHESAHTIPVLARVINAKASTASYGAPEPPPVSFFQPFPASSSTPPQVRS